MNPLIGAGVWLGVTALIGVYLFTLMRGEDQRAFLPGQTTAGHYQIELTCNACHNPDGGVNQQACIDCHGAELERVGDSHPVAKFAKATKAIMLKPIDGGMNAAHVQTGYCVTCHVEHTPQATGAMGLTQPGDYCKACHDDIQENRATHAGLAFTTCLTAGCHNFHDNSALFEKFFVDHMDEPAHLPDQVRVMRDYSDRFRRDQAGRDQAVVALTRATHDAPTSVEVGETVLHDWETTAHATAGINCTDCHNVKDDSAGTLAWVDRPTFESCQSCHGQETHGFLASRHGMRMQAGLSAMTPGQARLPMKPGASDTPMNCNACHSTHRYDTQAASFSACVQCHDDGHTLAYADSPHYQLWVDELSGVGEPGSGVSCATCHLPRVVEGPASDRRVEVRHNPNDYLRPNEKMIRPVCTSCHGLGFTIDALADPGLIANNFAQEPVHPHFQPSSFDMIREKLERLRKEGRANK